MAATLPPGAPPEDGPEMASATAAPAADGAPRPAPSALKCTFCRNVTKRPCEHDGTLPCQRCKDLNRVPYCTAFIDGRALRYWQRTGEGVAHVTTADACAAAATAAAAAASLAPAPPITLFLPWTPPRATMPWVPPTALAAMERGPPPPSVPPTPVRVAPPPRPRRSGTPPPPRPVLLWPAWAPPPPPVYDTVTTRACVNAGQDAARLAAAHPAFLDVDMADLALRAPDEGAYEAAAAAAAASAAAAAAAARRPVVAGAWDAAVPGGLTARDVWVDALTTAITAPTASAFVDAVAALDEAGTWDAPVAGWPAYTAPS